MRENEPNESSVGTAKAATPEESDRSDLKRLGPLDWGIHPFLFALLPILSPLAANSDDVATGEAVPALLWSSVLAAALTLGIWIFVRDWRKAALIASPLVLLALSYGHLYVGLKLIFGAIVVRHRYLAPPLVAAAIIWSFVVLRRLRASGPLTAALNVVGLVSLLFPLLTLLGATFARLTLEPEPEATPVSLPAAIPAGAEGPDIFYIIVDGYGRQDVLSDLYGYDNSGFLRSLQDRGFQIGERSTTNYIQTALSLASSLNMDYLDALLEDQGQTMRSAELRDLIWHSRVRRQLDGLGYAVLSFKSGYSYTSIEDADLYWMPEGQGNENEDDPVGSSSASKASAFEVLLLENTVFRILLDFSEPAREATRRYLLEPSFAEHRERVLFTLDRLGEVPALPGRYFVFAHVISPHPPFVFDAGGNPLTPDYPFSFEDGSHFQQYGFGTREDYITGYQEQLRYLNQLLVEAIDRILESSATTPIVVLQGDHGPGAYLRWDAVMDSNLEERSGILNAFLLPGAIGDVVYPTITPVNAFRLVLSQYFGADLPPLEDCTYFSSVTDRAQLVQVGDCLPPGRDWSAGGASVAGP